MKIEFTGRQTEVPPDARRLAERKLQKLARLLPAVTRAHVILTADKHRQVAEVSLHSRHADLAALAVTTDVRLSLAAAIGKLERQAEKQRTRRKVRKGAPSPRYVAPPPEDAKGDGEPRAPRVIRSRRAAVKPMTLDEAALELGARADSVLVYRDAATDRVSVLYRRRDGNLGLIEPEA
jgi:putative sigma-54 modulation protein